MGFGLAVLALLSSGTLAVLSPLPGCPSGTEEIYFTDFTSTNDTFNVGPIRQASSTDSGSIRRAYGIDLWGPVQSERTAEPPLAIALPNMPELSSYHWKADILFHETWDGCNDARDNPPPANAFFAEWVRVFEGAEGATSLRHYTSVSTTTEQVKCWPLQQSPDDRRLCVGGPSTPGTQESSGSYFVDVLTNTNSGHFTGDNAFGHVPGPWELKVTAENSQGYPNGPPDEPFSIGQIRVCGVFGTATVATDETFDDDSSSEETSASEGGGLWVAEPGFLFGAIGGLAVATGLVLGYSRSRINPSSEVFKSQALLEKKSGTSGGAGVIGKKDNVTGTPGVLIKSSKRRESKGRKNRAGSRGRTNSAGSRGRKNSAGSRGRAGSASSAGRRGSGGRHRASSGGSRAPRVSGGTRSSGVTSLSGASGGTRTSAATHASGVSGASKASGASGISKASGFTAKTGASSIATRIRRNPDGTLVED